MTTDRRRLPRRPAQAAGTSSEVFDDEIVVFCERTERLHCLNTSASTLWALCDGSRDLEAIVAEVAKLANTQEEAVRSSVEQGIYDLCQLGILH